MKPLTLDSKSWVYRLAFLLNNKWYKPSHISLCKLFWKCVLSIVACLLPVALLVTWAVLLVVQTFTTLVYTAAVVFVLGLIAAVTYFEDEIIIWQANRRRAKWAKEDARRNKPYRTSSVIDYLYTAIWGIKNRICPTIYIK